MRIFFFHLNWRKKKQERLISQLRISLFFIFNFSHIHGMFAYMLSNGFSKKEYYDEFRKILI